MATVYSDRGHGVRAPVVFYNRSQRGGRACSSPATSTGRRSSRAACAGSTAAASSPRSRRPRREVIIEGMKAAKAAGRRHLLRPQLPREAVEHLGRRRPRGRDRAPASSRTSTCSSATRRTCRRASASPGPRSRRSRKLDPSAFFGMIDQVVKKHPKVKVVATTLREVHSTNRHSWSAVAWIDGKTYVAPTCELDVLDRVGGGDGFASGLFYGLLTGEEPERGGQARLGARRAAHHLPRRHHHGHARAGARVRQGRLGPHPALVRATGDIRRSSTGRHRPHRPRRDGREPRPEHGEQGLHRRRLQPHDVGKVDDFVERPRRRGKNIVGAHSLEELVRLLKTPAQGHADGQGRRGGRRLHRAAPPAPRAGRHHHRRRQLALPDTIRRTRVRREQGPALHRHRRLRRRGGRAARARRSCPAARPRPGRT